AYFGTDAGKRAMKLVDAWPEGGDEALARILSLHNSTRERLPLAETDAMYRRIFEVAGRPSRVLDVACGLNPIYLAARGVPVLGVDAHLGAVELINRFAGKNALDARAEGIDLLTDPLPEGRFPLALLLKLLPLLGDAGYALLEKVDAGYVAVSFPTRTLSGRDVGMERHYGRGFSENCPDRFEILDRFVHRSELIYILKER
ncbi:MAG: 16S rRNA (guanine(1405)-N(7))-methyltransferase RmtF, partial [Clostridiales bacterium]|nr:16S rRNA (guanine(1405)-N(7))-methyltransferase RmtF [Clostridiales bacterium]